MSNYQHWQMKLDHSNVVWLGLDRQGAPVNTINDEVLDELNGLLHEIANIKNAKGLILYSLKKKGFIAGADIHSLAHLQQPRQIIEFLRKGQTVFTYLEALSIPTVAVIDGFCMGGGMELALACDYRIASDERHTKLGLPEVLLGFHPGWGGTVRLPKLIGGFYALTEVMLKGSALPATKAKALGIVDEVVPMRHLLRAAEEYVQKKPIKHKPNFIHALTNAAWVRPILAKIIRSKLRKQVREEHYPAPYAMLNLWEREGNYDERAYLKEADSVEQLVTKSDTSSNLIRAFLLRERMKSFAKDSDFQAKHVHVIGAGVMGGDIAAWCALSGLSVTLQDQSYEQIAPAIQRASKLFTKKLKKPRLVQAAMDRLLADPEGHGVGRADVIIEAVFENLEVKQKIMKSVEARASSKAIIATNTSSIPLDEISSVMEKPERLVGIHFFNPVAKMELVEIVSSKKTSKKITQDACAFVNQISRLPLPVLSSPGFLVNRILMPYLIECVQLLNEGYTPELIDEAALSFGMMMGPVELADTVGMDVCLAVAENLTKHFGGAVSERLRSMVQEKKLGRKTGEGFYRYRNGKPIKQKLTETTGAEEISDRLILRMINEAAACLREGVVADSDLLDAGMIFGTGFAPFRGGPMHYAKQFGEDKLNAVFSKLETQYGERFKANLSFE